MLARGLKGVRLVTGDRCAGLVAAVGELLPGARCRRCMVHFERNVLARVTPRNREVRRRTRMVGSFPDERSALMLVCARVRYVTSNEWSTRRYLDMSRLGETVREAN